MSKPYEISYCIKCGLSSETREISLVPNVVPMTKEGVCSYCDFSKQNKVDLFNHEKYKKLFEQRIESIKGKYEYDALVGISGGKDGAYVLHKLVRYYGLRVLTFTYDNHFMNWIVKDKIDELTSIYDVDHFYYTPKNLKSLYRGILKKAAVPCHACAMGAYYYALKTLFERKIPLFIHGRSPYQMLRNLDQKTFDFDPYFALSKSNFDVYNSQSLFNGYKKVFEKIESSISQLDITDEERMNVMEEFFLPLKNITPDFVPEAYAFFLTERYSEDNIRFILKAESGYISPKSHEDCLIHNAANYLTAIQYKTSVKLMETAAMLRFGHITKDEFDKVALIEDQEKLILNNEIKEELELMLKCLGLNQHELANWP